MNWNSILRKAKRCMDSSNMKQKVDKKKGQMLLEDMEEAAEKFKDILLKEIRSRPYLPPGVVQVLEDLEAVYPIRLPDGNYQIYIWFTQDLTRGTMSTHKEYYDINLAKLYNNGVDHIMKTIRETDEFGGWHSSLNHIREEHFAESAIEKFMSRYGDKYHVIEIKHSFDE